MIKTTRLSVIASIAVLAFGASALVQAQQSAMSFFITSVGLGKGGDLGGLEGADRHCQSLAQAAGAGSKTWRAYLSTQAVGGVQSVNARDRIGNGPWQNAKGVVIAKNVDDLHGDPNINKETALNENGGVVNASGDTPNTHDILTGSQSDGTAFAADKDMTCKNWTSSTQGTAMLGHHNRRGTPDTPANTSWNSAHGSRGPEGGCSQSDLRSTGGAGLLYCFALN
jgi:hypothetical protein